MELLLNVVDEEQIVRVGALWRSKFGCWAQRLETEKLEGAHQIRTIQAVLAHAQHNSVNVQFVLSKLQQRDERLLGSLGQQNAGQSNVQDVIVRVQHGLPDAESGLGDVQLEGDLDRFLLIKNALDLDVRVLVEGELRCFVESRREINVRVLR